MSEEKYDCIVVGAGPAGVSAAFTIARHKNRVLLLERGEYPGAKNVMGGILFTTALEEMIPDYKEQAPLERNITVKKLVGLSKDSQTALEFRCERFNESPYNYSFSCLRAKFDQWFASKAEEAGVELFSEVLVDDLYYENGKVAGIKVKGEEEPFLADCVILADGANSLIAKKAGLRKDFHSGQFVVGIKEVMSLDKGKIEDRFNLEGNEGAAYEYFGDATKGIVGSGFIYTNNDTLSVGVGVSLGYAVKAREKTSELIEYFKSHPMVRRLLKGAQTEEYLCHLLPEYGYNGMPKLYGDGLLVAGDASGMVNTSVHHEGSNLAMKSGMIAGETFCQAKIKNDFSAEYLRRYQEELERTYVMKDLKKFKYVHRTLETTPYLIERYPQLVCELMEDFFKLDGKPKPTKLEWVKKLASKVSIPKLVIDSIKGGIAFV